MKKKLLTILWLCALAVLLPATCGAQTSVSLSWDASTTPGVSYNLYRTKTALGCGAAGAIRIIGPACLGVNTAPITVLTFNDTPGVSGRWFYVACAVDADAIESVNSNVLAVIIPPSPPANLRRN